MGAPELLALSLGLSVVVAGLAWCGGRGFERASGDPALKDRVWAVALALPALPPLATAALLLAPAPTRDVALPITSIPTIVGTTASTTGPATGTALPLDPAVVAWAILAIAGLLALARLTTLAIRARRLRRILNDGQPAAEATVIRIEEAARRLGVVAPTALISATTTDALLSGLGRTRLVLPDALSDEAADAVIAHELAHLKRRDHQALWLEEAVLALLAFNPLMPALRGRRDAAREEACDALALEHALPDTRRAYARILIEALRDRAGPQTPGGALPALTFTGAGRTTAMHRLKAVLNPAAPAGRRTRLIAAVAGLTLLGVTGVTTAALAGQREAEVRIVAAAPQEQRAIDMSDGRQLLNGQPLPDGLPVWALNPERVDIRTSDGGGGVVDFILPFTGTTPVSVDGRRLPEGFPVRGINPEAVARVDMQDEHLMLTLKPEAEVRGRRTGDAPEADAAAAAARASGRRDADAKFRRASATDYQRYCASGEPDEDGFCMGVMFGHLGRAPDNGLCVPEGLSPGADTTRIDSFLARGKAQVARLSPRRDEGAYEYSERALKTAYPCPAPARSAAAAMQAAAPASDQTSQQLSVRVAQPARTPMVLVEGDVVRVVMESQPNGRAPRNILAREYAIPQGGSAELEAHFDLKGDQLPSLTRGQVYTLTAEVRGRDGIVRYSAEPATIRLAPGSNVNRLRPELVLQP